MIRRRLVAVFAVAVSSALLACSAILGLDDTTVVAGYHRDASLADAPVTDAGDAGDAGTDGGCAADLVRDPKNCGSCGHDCLGGACVAAKCQPLSLVDDPKYSPEGLAVDDTFVFFTDSNTQSILRVAKDGDGGISTIVAGEPNLFDLVAGGGYIYFSNPSAADGGPGGLLSRCPTTGCTQPTRTDFLSGTPKQPASLAMDSAHLYYAFANSSGEVWRCDRPACTNAKRLVTAPEPLSLALNGSNVSWYAYQTGAIFTCAKGGCVTPDSRGHGSTLVYGMAADATYLYFADVAGTISRVEVANFGVEDPVIEKQNGPHYILEDGPDLYWINRGTGPSFSDGALLRCPKSDCGAKREVLATGLIAVYALVQDADALYYASSGDGRVWKLRKP